MAKPVKIPRFELIKSPDFKSVYATGVFGGLNPDDGRLVFYIDHIEPKMKDEPPGAMETEKVVRELLVEVHVSPQQFKSIAKWMADHINRLEQAIGKLPPTEEEKKAPTTVT